MSFYQTASSPWVSSEVRTSIVILRPFHGPEALHCDQLAVGDEADIARLKCLVELRRHEGVELSLTILAHLGQWSGRIHVHQRAQFRVVDSDVRDKKIEPRVQTIDDGDEAIRFVRGRRPVL